MLTVPSQPETGSGLLRVPRPHCCKGGDPQGTDLECSSTAREDELREKTEEMGHVLSVPLQALAVYNFEATLPKRGSLW